MRPARRADVAALVALEDASFDHDRLSRRSFLWMLTKAKAVLLVAEDADGLAGYGLILLHAGGALARVYSVVVAERRRGSGLGRRLMVALEEAARDRGAAHLRLEVRPDNQAAITLYESLGYHRFAVVHDYYEDHADAHRYEKRIVFPEAGLSRRVPYYAQTTDFTCGPSSLMMAMKALDADRPFDRREEIQLWREATTIFMTTGHGGCDPYGLALAAQRRGFTASIFVSDTGPLFVDSVRTEAKKDVIRLVHDDFAAQVKSAGIPVETSALGLADLMARMDEGAVPLILISAYRFTGQRAPHWIVLTGHDDRFIYAHDPDLDEEEAQGELDCLHIPMTHAAFSDMTQWGRRAIRALILISKAKGAAA